MRVRLVQLDGHKLPNVALMAIAAHHRALGDEVVLKRVGSVESVETGLFEEDVERTYASLIFERSRPLAERLLALHPDAIVGGTGWDVTGTLEAHGITTREQDYAIYPEFGASIGFTQRGCRLRCPFCVVPKKEGAVREERTIAELWRGDPHPRDLVLLDNDFFGQERWRERIAEIRDGGFRVSFCQGINARMLDDETAAAIASVDYRDDSFSDKAKRLYCAWDNRKDEARLFAGLEALVRHGVKPHHIMVYVLVGYWPGETMEDGLYRVAKLRAFGAVPYPMPFTRTRELVGFARWVVKAYDKRCSWAEFQAADYRPERLGIRDEHPLFAGKDAPS